ncbi:MAG: hypothetical protein HBSAPP01_08570 [Candidatus Brocadia sapporoensis]|nr:MAG: hypothetical protein HBSAPP01_08570 [Candidatus Brocadia sapporoensis]
MDYLGSTDAMTLRKEFITVYTLYNIVVKKALESLQQMVKTSFAIKEWDS